MKQQHPVALLSVLLVLILLTTGSLPLWAFMPPEGNLISEAEPNQRVGEAQPVTFPSMISGSFSGKYDKDWFRLEVPEPGLPELYALLTVQGQRNVTLKLLDSDSRTINESNFFGFGEDEYLTSLMLPAGTYYLVVDSGPGRFTEAGTYTLSLDRLPEVRPAEVKEALNKALDFIVSGQQEAGSFPGNRGDSGGIPALAVQALMGAECLERNDWDAIYRSVDFLLGLYHDPDQYTDARKKALSGGGIFGRDGLYDHGIAMITLIEAHALGVEGLEPVIRAGLDFIYRAQATGERPAVLKGPIPADSVSYGGWRYKADSTNADISVTGWQIIALISARKAGFEVPQKRLDEALGYVRRCFNEKWGSFTYRPAGSPAPGRAAMGALSMQLLGAGGDPKVKSAIPFMMNRGPSWGGEYMSGYPFYFWYYATRAAYLEGGATWDTWHKAVCGLLVRHQNGNGSWNRLHHEEQKTNDTYVTSLGAMILEFCCGSVPIYMRDGAAPPRPVPPPRNEITVTISRPENNILVQGAVEIEAVPVVPERTEVKRVTFYLDGEELGQLEQEPWVWPADLGPGVREHKIRVVAENSLGKEASAEVATRAGRNDVRVMILTPRSNSVISGVQPIEVDASAHADSPLASVTISVDGQELFSGAEPPFAVDFDFGSGGGQEIVARAVNALGKEAEARAKLREIPPLEVDFSATVTDSANNYIIDLEQDRFAVSEDGVPQEILRFSREVTPVSMALVLDTSGSMKRRVSTVREAAAHFVSQIRPVDRVMVMTFADTVRVTQRLTSDVPALQAAIRSCGARGGTALYDAVVQSSKGLKREKGRTAVILLTDGKDENNPGTAPGSRHTLEQCITAAKEAGVTVYALGLGSKVARDVLETIAMETGGRAYFPPTLADVDEVYGLIARELRSQYTIGYSSTNRTRDRTWRVLEISVPGTEYAVRAKPGYTAR